jgi:RNA polymerase sigma factor (TIGR02999 family)
MTGGELGTRLAEVLVGETVGRGETLRVEVAGEALGVLPGRGAAGAGPSTLLVRFRFRWLASAASARQRDGAPPKSPGRPFSRLRAGPSAKVTASPPGRRPPSRPPKPRRRGWPRGRSGRTLRAGALAEADPEAVTELLQGWRNGDGNADAELLERVYQTLRSIASAQLRRERVGHTLQPTALVHEAYLRLVGQREVDWRDRAHFFGAASVTMRRILEDHARRRNAKKRDAGEPLSIVTGPGESVDLLDLDRALDRFGERFARQAKVVEMRYFGGLELEDIATVLEVSDRTVKRDWAFARAWLREALGAAD